MKRLLWFQLSLMQTRQPGTLDESICQLVYCMSWTPGKKNYKILKSFLFGRCRFHLTATTECFALLHFSGLLFLSFFKNTKSVQKSSEPGNISAEKSLVST